MSARSIRALCILALLSLFVSVIALGLGYSRITAGLIQSGQAYRIGKDGWVKDGAKLQLPALAKTGNHIQLTFNDWRPPMPPSVLAMSVCGQALGEFLIEAGTSIALSLNGDCSPRLLSIQVKNPTRLSAEDAREVGAQLQSIQVSSSLGIALIDPIAVLVAGLCLWMLAALVWLALKPAGMQALSLIVPIIAFFPLRRVDISDPEMALYLAGTLCLILIGARTYKRQRNPSQNICGPIPALLALIITGLGAALRLKGIDFGLPHNFHPDEVPKVNAIMTMVQAGDLNPRYFLHPSLLLYSTYAMNTLLHYFGVEGDFRSTAFLAGRLVSVCAGSLSIWITFLLARRVVSPWFAVIAAMLLATFPLHVTCSRYLKEDALLVFWILLCAWACLRAAQNRSGFSLLAAGIFAGLACSTKYSGLVAVGLLAATPWLNAKHILAPDRSLFKWSVLAATLAGIAFFMASPYILLDQAKFQSDFAYERKHMVRGHTEAIDAWSQFWMYHVAFSLQKGLTAVPLVFSIVGLGLLLARRQAAAWFILGLCLLFYLPAEWVKSKPAPQPERYIVPCLPFLAIAAAALLEELSRRSHILLVITPILLWLPALRSYQLAQDLSYDTRQAARDWMVQNAPPGSRVLLDWEPYNALLPSQDFESEFFRREKISAYLHPKTLQESNFDFLLLSTLFYDRYFSQPEADPAIRRRFEAVFKRVPIIHEVNAPSGTFGFHNPTITIFDLRDPAFDTLRAQLEAQVTNPELKTDNQKLSILAWAQR